MRILLCLLMLIPCVVEAKKKYKKYSIIYRVKKMDGMMEYGVEERTSIKTEDNDEIAKQKALMAEYAEAMRNYDEDLRAYKKDKEGVAPTKPLKPDFTYEYKRYVTSKELKDMKKILLKRQERAKRYNEAREKKIAKAKELAENRKQR